MTTVTHYFSHQAGGNCMVDFIVLSNRTFITLTDDYAVLWNHKSGKKPLEQWLDELNENDSEIDCPSFLYSTILEGCYTNMSKQLHGMTYVHSFPNNKIYTTHHLSIDVETLEVKELS